jgi:hypothetical protein
LARSVARFLSVDFMKLSMYHDGKPEASHQLVEVINEDADGIGIEL